LGHLDDRRDSACDCRSGTVSEVLPLDPRRLAQVSVNVDPAWENDLSGRIEPSAREAGCIFNQTADAPVAYDDIGPKDIVLAYHGSSGDDLYSL
jgi:hypothetical protein